MRPQVLRLAVTGRHGQLARALVAAGPIKSWDIITLGRPDFDLARPETIATALISARPDVIINAAAWTAVDLAESHQQEAMAVNGHAAGVLAATAARLKVPIIHLSTDCVFDGAKAAAYQESDIPSPLSAYGRSKQEGEQRIGETMANHVIVRTSWVFAAKGKNFPLTMLSLAASRDEISVVADQFGCPTYAPDLADALLDIAARLVAEPGNMRLRGIFHIAGQGELSWADFASAVFEESRRLGGPFASVRRITTAEYPTPARRPANARLDSGKARAIYGLVLPHWQDSIRRCLIETLTASAQGI
ncbi:MAG: dTDP-4-dehydrorhamnose reductase [Beijerinckiaceae bacterium]